MRLIVLDLDDLRWAGHDLDEKALDRIVEQFEADRQTGYLPPLTLGFTSVDDDEFHAGAEICNDKLCSVAFLPAMKT